jgi:hypothetical protein
MGVGPIHLLGGGELSQRLAGLGVHAEGEEIDPVDEGLPEMTRVIELDRRLARSVHAAAKADRFPLVLAGNCNSCLGTVAGVGAERLGVIWFDAHADRHRRGQRVGVLRRDGPLDPDWLFVPGPGRDDTGVLTDHRAAGPAGRGTRPRAVPGTAAAGIPRQHRVRNRAPHRGCAHGSRACVRSASLAAVGRVPARRPRFARHQRGHVERVCRSGWPHGRRARECNRARVPALYGRGGRRDRVRPGSRSRSADPGRGQASDREIARASRRDI